MTDISFNPTSQGSKGHQTLGSGGSFWLPPEMKIEKFETNLERFKGGSNALFNHSSGKGAKPFASLGDSSVKLFQKELSLVHTAEKNPNKFTEEKSFPAPNQKIAKVNTSVSSSRVSADSLLQQPGVAAYNSGQSESHLIPVNPRAIFINSISLSTLSRKTRKKNSSNEFTSSSNGTDRATLSGNRNESLLPFFSDPSEDILSSQAKVLNSEELVNGVKDLIAYTPFTCFNQKGILRLAFTLEDGSSVSVRIESVKDNLQICFISEDSHVLKSLSDNIYLSEDHFREASFPLQFHFFTSYKQMDDLLPLTLSTYD